MKLTELLRQIHDIVRDQNPEEFDVVFYSDSELEGEREPVVYSDQPNQITILIK